jgi:transaldolase
MSRIPDLPNLKIKLFADGADVDAIRALAEDSAIKGFTTNPTLMRMAGITDYEAFAREVLETVTDRPISFEVFADEFDDMERQAKKIATWAPNVNVKIPVTNTRGESAAPLVERLSNDGVVCNVTAIFTLDQVQVITDAFSGGTAGIVSVFAGRIADTGIDPVPHMVRAVEIASSKPDLEVLWASPRELLNIFHADQSGCHIITVTSDLLNKLSGVGKSLELFSRETVDMFFRDAQSAGYDISA